MRGCNDKSVTFVSIMNLSVKTILLSKVGTGSDGKRPWNWHSARSKRRKEPAYKFEGPYEAGPNYSSLTLGKLFGSLIVSLRKETLSSPL